ncbi:hypothetical protein ACA29_12560 [Lederbergia galactosidilytica]|uniref:Uncharacterized protein n=1 Tax=Lederbergia galactosidilytica TaxID=217031 RepID=A0A0Q9XUC5_9BACI|nr:hypothetical protein ACA29_12560 [Lederbergia galactosidilytica]
MGINGKRFQINMIDKDMVEIWLALALSTEKLTGCGGQRRCARTACIYRCTTEYFLYQNICLSGLTKALVHFLVDKGGKVWQKQL